MDLGNTLRTIRREKNITQSEAVLKLKISQTYLSQLEANKKEPSLPMLKKISKFYGIPVPVIMWKSLTDKDIVHSKKEAWAILKVSVDNLIKEFF